MAGKKYYDPLLDAYFDKEEVKSFKSKDSVREIFKQGKEKSKVEASEIKVDLGSGSSYQKVLVGSYGDVPFYALVDRAKGTCIPVIQ